MLRGAIPVFVDVREDTLNLDERRIEAAIISRTRAIAPVHYAGVACEMDPIVAIAKRRDTLRVVEDAAQGITASYKGTPLGAIGDLGSFSFHETKNIMSRFGRTDGDLPLTVDLPERLIRLPFWIGLDEALQQRICDTLSAILGQ